MDKNIIEEKLTFYEVNGRWRFHGEWESISTEPARQQMCSLSYSTIQDRHQHKQNTHWTDAIKQV